MRSSALANVLKPKLGQREKCRAGRWPRRGGTLKELLRLGNCQDDKKEWEKKLLAAGKECKALFNTYIDLFILVWGRSLERKSQQQESNTSCSQCLLNQ